MNPNRVVTKSGLIIGCAYIAPPPRPSADAEAIQTALLRERRPLFERALDVFNRHTVEAFVAIAVIGILLGLTKPLWH